jgi:gas vesicle protein
MSTPNYPGGRTAADLAGEPMLTPDTSSGSDTSGSDTKQKAQQVAGTAADEGRQVTGVAKDEARHVAGEAKQQARGVMNDAMSQAQEQSRTQRDRLVNTMKTFSDDLEQMASQGGRTGMATDLARQVAGKTRDLSSQLEGKEPTEILDDVRSFARRRPGTFLLGALVAGAVAGRLARGAKDASSGDSSTGSARSPYDQPRGTAAGYPTAGTGYPTDPVVPGGAGATVGGPLDPSLDTPGMPSQRVTEEPWGDVAEGKRV